MLNLKKNDMNLTHQRKMNYVQTQKSNGYSLKFWENIMKSSQDIKFSILQRKFKQMLILLLSSINLQY